MKCFVFISLFALTSQAAEIGHNQKAFSSSMLARLPLMAGVAAKALNSAFKSAESALVTTFAKGQKEPAAAASSNDASSASTVSRPAPPSSKNSSQTTVSTSGTGGNGDQDGKQPEDNGDVHAGVGGNCKNQKADSAKVSSAGTFAVFLGASLRGPFVNIVFRFLPVSDRTNFAAAGTQGLDVRRENARNNPDDPANRIHHSDFYQYVERLASYINRASSHGRNLSSFNAFSHDWIFDSSTRNYSLAPVQEFFSPSGHPVSCSVDFEAPNIYAISAHDIGNGEKLARLLSMMHDSSDHQGVRSLTCPFTFFRQPLEAPSRGALRAIGHLQELTVTFSDVEDSQSTLPGTIATLNACGSLRSLSFVDLSLPALPALPASDPPRPEEYARLAAAFLAQNCAPLKTLNLNGIRIDDLFLGEVSRIPSIRVLVLNRFSLTSQIATGQHTGTTTYTDSFTAAALRRALDHLPNLRELRIEALNLSPDQTEAIVASSCAVNLETLSIAGSTFPNGPSVFASNSFHSLRTLDLRFCRFTPRQIVLLETSNILRSVTTLSLSVNIHLSYMPSPNEAILSMNPNLQNLRILNVRLHSPQYSDELSAHTRQSEIQNAGTIHLYLSCSPSIDTEQLQVTITGISGVIEIPRVSRR